ncbi:MAG: UTP--glucose-1-phosphate uridylyltransferase GalU [Clostridia bacterium]|nr:UTP--glucose-1-phosphate uridylyltransferase GalU [Clostridia bacterium]
MKIKKAIIPAAGLGTRVLPASKAMPKEMLPIVDKPAIQYIVEEAVKAGITDILIITNRGKGIIEDHFDHSIELELQLENKGNNQMLETLKATAQLANIYFIRQKVTKGLGDAVLRAKEFVGDEPFAVLYGDDVIIGEIPAIGELCDAYEKYGKSVVGIKEVTDEQIVKYSSLKTQKLEDKIFDVSDMIEKPSIEEKFSNYSILGRCVLDSEIFEILERTPLGAGGELQLTDAMAQIARTKGMTGVDFSGTRYDMGNKFGILKANIEVGLNHSETKDELKVYIKELAERL